MMPVPSLLDRALGNLPMFLLVCGAFLLTLISSISGEAPYPYAPFVLGFLALMSRASRARILAEEQWQDEKAAIAGRTRKRITVWRAIWLAPFWALLLVMVYLFVAGAMGFDGGTEASRVVDSITAAVPYFDVRMAAGTLLVLLAAVVVQRLVRRVVRSTPKGRTAAGTAKAGKWDGTVRVMLPVPKDDT